MKRLLAAIFIICFSLVPSYGGESEEWDYVAPNNYVYKDGIMGLENMYGFSFMLKSYNKGQYEPINGKDVEYTLGQYEINCLRHTYKIGVLDSYDSKDNFVNGDYNRYAQFQPIVSGTAIDAMALKLCKFSQ
ncbi:MAG TPA: hypothetical protein DEO94_06455 [Cyanobacteria bacterium UBA11991]|nr:hypothetical protein [Cyanobacteriota bacterium]MDY6358112.1 hypothetical protein [Cyanobacteriota bacterium]MDY6365016.1 hypothetical protein [Cyanobacteriota bacterium]MDY6382325.1 hypothetical protein [Cyanobacteriota bacterium]HCB11754.1 hypothetical protein [Cyanobacteria bacterium UBA11991]